MLANRAVKFGEVMMVPDEGKFPSLVEELMMVMI